MDEKKYKVMIARFPGSGWECTGCVDWLLKVQLEAFRDPRVESLEWFRDVDTPITMVRNRAVKEALARGIDYLLMVDSDMVPDNLVGQESWARPFWETAWNFMMRRRIREAWESFNLADFPATIGAPYCGPPPVENVFIFRWTDSESDDPDPAFRLEMFTREDAAMRRGIERVAALPTGLILYDMRAFGILPPPWFDYEYGDKQRSIKATTEDVFQTRNAAMIGLPQYVAWDCWSGHLKPKVVRKPRVLTEDVIHAGLREAIISRRSAEKRIGFVCPDDGDPRPLEAREEFLRKAETPNGSVAASPAPGGLQHWRDEVESA